MLPESLDTVQSSVVALIWLNCVTSYVMDVVCCAGRLDSVAPATCRPVCAAASCRRRWATTARSTRTTPATTRYTAAAPANSLRSNRIQQTRSAPPPASQRARVVIMWCCCSVMTSSLEQVPSYACVWLQRRYCHSYCSAKLNGDAFIMRSICGRCCNTYVVIMLYSWHWI